MATQVYSSHQQTRQQLDELDALLQRMLTLPLHSPEPAKAPEPEAAPTLAPLPPGLPQTHVVPRSENSPPVVQGWRLAPPTHVEEPPMAIVVGGPEETAHTPAPYPYSMVFGQPLPAEPAPAPPPPMAQMEPKPQLPTSAPVAGPIWAIPVATEKRRSHSLLSLPFVAINWLFDLLTYLLGPLGSFLRHPLGRNALGWLGIIMFLGAAGWAAAEWYRADWPRYVLFC